jgi:LPS-assembly protein
VRHNGLYGGRWRSLINYTRVSDVDLIRDLETSRLDARRDVNLLQLGQIDYLGDDWLLNLQAAAVPAPGRGYPQRLQETAAAHGAVPQRGHALPPQPPRSAAVLQLRYGQRAGRGAAPLRGSRGHLSDGLVLGLPQAHGEVPHARLPPGAPARGARRASRRPLGARQRRRRPVLRTAHAPGRARRAADPGAAHFYLYSQYDEQSDQPDFDSAELTFNYNQLFRDTRFSGRDRLDDANQVSIGLTTRFLDARSGEEYFNASIGQIYYFTNRRVRLNASDPELDRPNSELAGEFNFYPNERLSCAATCSTTRARAR